MIWAIILAAGESKRMGKPKLLLPYGERTIIETVIENVIKSKVNQTLVILGSDGELIQERIKSLPLEITINPHYSRGMLSSVHWGFQKIPGDAEAVLVVLGDQPTVSTAVIDRIIDAFKKTGRGIILPVHRKERGHPVLIDMKYRDEVMKLKPNVGLRGVVYSHPGEIFEVRVETSSVLRDIDSQNDYEKALKN